MRPHGIGILSLLTFWIHLGCWVYATDPSDPEYDFFLSKIEPVLVESCYSCHSQEAEELAGGLAVDTADGLRSGGDSGPAIDIEHPEKSLLLLALRHQSGLAMPPDSPPCLPRSLMPFNVGLKKVPPIPGQLLRTLANKNQERS